MQETPSFIGAPPPLCSWTLMLNKMLLHQITKPGMMCLLVCHSHPFSLSRYTRSPSFQVFSFIKLDIHMYFLLPLYSMLI